MLLISLTFFDLKVLKVLKCFLKKTQLKRVFLSFVVKSERASEAGKTRFFLIKGGVFP